MLTTATLVDIIKPVDQIEEGEGDGEDDPGPLVYGVDVCEVWDLDFELRGPPPQAVLLVPHGPIQGWSTVQVSARHGLSVLDAGAVVGEHGGAWVVERSHHIWTAHLGGQVCQEDVAMSVDLQRDLSSLNKTFKSGCKTGRAIKNVTMTFIVFFFWIQFYTRQHDESLKSAHQLEHCIY